MIRLGIIGTSSIAHAFATAAKASGQFEIKAIYSRNQFTAQSFGEGYGADIFVTDLEKFTALEEVDAVYIASPNSLHFKQAMSAIANGKHLIVEKPIFSNTKEWEAAFSAAKANNVFLFEAARHLHEPNFELVGNEIAKLGEIDGATFTYAKYSSRYDQVLAGEEPNIFSLAFSGGALADLGVYLLYAAIAWFGVPDDVDYAAKKIQTGVDGAGTVLLKYPYFTVSLHTAKIYNSFAASEIYSGKKTLLLDGVNLIQSVELVDSEAEERYQLAEKASGHFMDDEVRAFARVLNDPENPDTIEDYERWTQISRDVNRTMEALRKKAGIVYPADLDEA
nr:Gfo/Idh/MocA family oxidoreductase [uncultured Trichococcus sp.]